MLRLNRTLRYLRSLHMQLGGILLMILGGYLKLADPDRNFSLAYTDSTFAPCQSKYSSLIHFIYTHARSFVAPSPLIFF